MRNKVKKPACRFDAMRSYANGTTDRLFFTILCRTQDIDAASDLSVTNDGKLRIAKHRDVRLVSGLPASLLSQVIGELTVAKAALGKSLRRHDELSATIPSNALNTITEFSGDAIRAIKLTATLAIDDEMMTSDNVDSVRAMFSALVEYRPHVTKRHIKYKENIR